MCNSGELIQIGTEQLRNERIFIDFPDCIFISLIGAIL